MSCRVEMNVRGLLLAIVVMISALGWADGKLFGRVGTAEEPGIRHQRALIGWRDGVQTLVIENTVETGGKGAWILPIPAEPDLIDIAPSGYFSYLEARYRMRLNDGTGFLFPVIAIFLCVLLTAVLQKKDASPLRFTIYNLFAGLLPLFIFAIFYPVFAQSKTPMTDTFGFEKVGSYDVATIAPGDLRAGVAWLNANGFAVNAEEERVLIDYAARGWSFVAAKLRDSGRVRLDPLVMQCRVEKAVYPMALTGLQEGPLNLELYVLADHFATVDGLVPLAAKTLSIDKETAGIVGPARCMTRLSGRINLGASTKDLEIGWADAQPPIESLSTQAGKSNAIIFRLLSSVMGGVLLVTPFLLKRYGRARAVMIGAGVGLLFGTGWSIAPMASRVVAVKEGSAIGELSRARTSEWQARELWAKLTEDGARKVLMGFESRGDMQRTEISSNGMKQIYVTREGDLVIRDKKWTENTRPTPAR